MRRLTEISDLFAAICEPREDFVLTRPFGWMDLDTAPPADPRVAQAGEPDLDRIERLLEQSFPDSRARPAAAGIRRWWILRDRDRVVACAADAWSTEGVGVLAGVATALAAAPVAASRD